MRRRVASLCISYFQPPSQGAVLGYTASLGDCVPGGWINCVLQLNELSVCFPHSNRIRVTSASRILPIFSTMTVAHQILALNVSVQFSPVTQSYPPLCHPMDCSTPGFPVHHQLPKLTQTHVHWVGDASQPSHSLLSPSPPAFSYSQRQGLFRWVSSLHQVAKGLEFI